jgi:hypothetical protein
MRDLLNVVSQPSEEQRRHGRLVCAVKSSAGETLGFQGIPGHQAVVFLSGYQNISLCEMAEWAYDLHSYALSIGGAWENYEAAEQEALRTAEAAQAQREKISSLRDLRAFGAVASTYRVGQSVPAPPIHQFQETHAEFLGQTTHKIEQKPSLPFDEERKFAQQYWQQHSEAYRQSSYKNLWIREAVVDGNNIYLLYKNAHWVRRAQILTLLYKKV